MKQFENVIHFIVDNILGLPLVTLIILSGLIFSFYLGFPQFRLIKHSLDIIRGKYDDKNDQGEISHFEALCSALSATVGLGNIAGVAVAISLAGPGAVFWFWLAGILGMTTKFTEVTLALMHRTLTPQGVVHGGPMFTIRHGLPKKFHFLGWLYALFIVFSSFGAGNLFQINQIAQVLHHAVKLPHWISGVIFTGLTFLILVGGIKRIGQVTSRLVPTMVFIYVLGAMGILLYHYTLIPSMLMMILEGAFQGTAAIGGFAGAGIAHIMMMGIRRGAFSNEAGMGSAAMAHSAAVSSPVQEGIVALLEPFIDTIVVCSITAMVLLTTGVWNEAGIQGSELTVRAFESVYGEAGRWLITVSVVLFAFSTILGWAYYGEQGVTYVAGEKWITPYRIFYSFLLIFGAVSSLGLVLSLADLFYGMLAFPNLIAVYYLLPKVKAALKQYEKKRRP